MYISDFESDSGSEIAEKHVFSAHTKNPQAIHFDSPVLTRNNRVEIASISKQSDNKTTTDPKSSAEAKTKTSAIEIENSTGKFKGFVKENSLENESEGIDSCNTDKFIHYDDLPVKPKKNTAEPKKPRQVKSAKVNSKSLSTLKNLSSSITDPCFSQTPNTSPFIQDLRQAISHTQNSSTTTLQQLHLQKLDYFTSLAETITSVLYPPSAVRLKTRPPAESQVPSITITATIEETKLTPEVRPTKANTQEPEADKEVPNRNSGIITYNTPSFSETEIYDNFNTFGKLGNPPENKTVQALLGKVEDQDESAEEDNPYEMIVIENDTEKTRNNKIKIFEDRKNKRIEELVKRQIKKSPSPERVPKEKLKQIHILSPGISPKPSPRFSPRPSTKAEIRSSPKPTHKTREEIKSTGDKYRRHKNLPNLVYNKPSNRKIVKNAISQVCIAGDANRTHREEILCIIENNKEINYFIIVFSEPGRRDCRGLYTHDPNTGEINKIYGPGYLPEVLDSAMVASYFRYDSGAKEFKLLQCKDFITATDAVALKKFHRVYENS